MNVMINTLIMNEIKKLYLSFDDTYDYYEKGYIWYVLEYLKKIFPQNKEIKEMYYDISIKINTNLDDVLKMEYLKNQSVKTFIQQNTSFLKQYIPKYQKKTDELGKLTIINSKDIFTVFNDFLSSLSGELIHFYQTMLDDGRIIYGDSNNTINTSLNCYNSIIIIKKIQNLKDILILAHELAHAYYIYCNHQKIIERKNPLNAIKDEIPSKIVEMCFINFLFEKKIIEDSLFLKSEFHNTMYYCSQKRNDFYYLKYLIGAHIASSINSNIEIEKYFKHVYKSNVQNLVLEINKKQGLRKVLKK